MLINFKSLVYSCGYKRYYKISNPKKITQTLNKIKKTNGPVFVEVKIIKGVIEKLKRPKDLISVKKNFIKT